MTTSADFIKVRRAERAPARSASEDGRSLGEAVPHCETGGAAVTPIDNHGGNEQTVQLVMSDGELKQVLVRAPANGQVAFVDQCSFTFHVETLERLGYDLMCSDQTLANHLSEVMESIFGFGLTGQRAKGYQFYKSSYDMGDFGIVAVGGQKDTVLVHLHGLGALKAIHGWEMRVYRFLTEQAIRPKLTRVDLAHDDFLGETISADWALQQWREGGFTWSGAAPEVEQLGNWLKPNGSGRTFGVGKRKSGKYCRVYEKGREQGCKNSSWTRIEVEVLSRDRVIPFDALIDPSPYLAGSYPCCSQLYEQADRIKTEKTCAQYNLDKMVEVTRVQMGRQLRFLKNYLDDADQVLDLVMHPDPLAVPKRLKAITSGINTMPTFLHHLPVDHLRPEQINFEVNRTCNFKPR